MVVNRAEKPRVEANDSKRSIRRRPASGGKATLNKTSSGTRPSWAFGVKDEQRTQAEILAKNAEMIALGLEGTG